MDGSLNDWGPSCIYDDSEHQRCLPPCVAMQSFQTVPPPTLTLGHGGGGGHRTAGGTRFSMLHREVNARIVWPRLVWSEKGKMSGQTESGYHCQIFLSLELFREEPRS